MVRYEAGGWGVGELWFDGPRLLWAMHPRAGARARGPSIRSAERFAAYFAGEDVSFDDVELDLEEETPFGRRLAEALRAVPRGEVVSYGELAELAGRRRAARAAGSFCARNRFAIVIPCHRVVGVDGLGSYGSLGLDYKRRLLALEGGMALSDELRNELAAIAPRRDCCRLAELSALFHSAGAVHLLGRGEVSLHLDVASKAVARRAFSLLRAFGVDVRDPHLPAPRLRARHPLPAARRRQRAGAPGAARGRRADLDAGAARAAAEARRRAQLLPFRLPARRAARRRLGERAARAAPGAARGGPGRRRVPRRRRRRRGGRAAGCRAARPRLRLREGRARRSATRSPRPARATRCSRSRSAR